MKLSQGFRFLLATLGFALVLPLPSAPANEVQSELLYTQALIPFRKAEKAYHKALETGETQYKQEAKALYEKALKLFQRGAAEEPPHNLAVYYLGVVYGKLRRYDAAIPHLQKTVERRPDMVQARLDLAVAYYHVRRYREALTLLSEVTTKIPKNGLAHYYTGLCYAGLKDYTAAIASLKRSTQLHPRLLPYAHHYSGLAHLEQGQLEEAIQALHSAAAAAPQTKLAARSLELSRKIRRQQKQLEADKRWKVRLGIASEFDSNVVLQPDSGSTSEQISDDDDLRMTFSAGGSFDFWRTKAAYVTADYDFYQSLHRDLDDFDLQAHRLRLIGGWSPRPFLDLSLEGGSNYYRVGGDSYLLELYAMPTVGFFTRPWAYTKLSYRFVDQDYRISFFDPARDADRHEVAVRQYFLMDGFERYVFIGYKYDQENPDRASGKDFRYDGNLVEAGLRMPGPGGTNLDLIYSFHNRDYDFPNSRTSPPFSRKRDDDIHWVSLTLRKSLTPTFEVYAGYRGTFNDSNIDAFEYHRHIGSIGFRLVY